jgi:MFS superfamily sulfate permease-like transporter
MTDAPENADAASIAPGTPRASWHRDFLASLVVFLIALPLCMGIAIASGVPVAAGLATGIIGGLVVGMLAGAPLQVSGPAAGLTVIVLGIVQSQGLETLGLVVLVAGLIQIAAGLGGIGQWFRAVSPAVVEGMLAGIGILIFASQFHVMVDDAPRKNGLQNIASIPDAVRKGLPWPVLGPAEHRRTRSHWLREFGTLHADQLQVQKRAEELVRTAPASAGAGFFSHDEPAKPETEPAEVKLDTARLPAVIEMQEAMIERLKQRQQAAANLTEAELPASLHQQLLLDLSNALQASETALADLKAESPSLEFSQLRASEALVTAQSHFKSHDAAAKIGLLTIAVMLAWQWLPWKKLKLLPAPLLAVTTATAVATVLALPVVYVEIPDQLANDLRIPTLALLQSADWWNVLQLGLVVALVASAETLLCAAAVDQMHSGPRTQYNRELAAQGVGNFLCGLVGALPMTGVIVRSAANVQAGATSRASAILHGVWLLIFVVALGWLLRMIPTASLAAMLVYTGVRLVNFRELRNFWKLDKLEAAIFVTTATIVVVEDLLKGVVVGIVLAAVKLLWQFSYLKVDVQPAAKGQPAVVSLHGAATFLRLPQLAHALDKISPRDAVRVSFDGLTYIDHACLDLIENWHKRHQAAGGEMELDWDALHARYRSRPLAADATALADPAALSPPLRSHRRQ